LIAVAIALFSCAPPASFPRGSVVVITRGESVADVAQALAGVHVVAHASVLHLLLRVSGGSGHMQAGAYLFSSPEDALTVAYRLITGSYDLPAVRLTFFEGETIRDLATRVRNAFSDSVSAPDIISAAQGDEGYLFPDTYLFSPSADASTIVQTMRANFDAKIAPLTNDIAASGHSLSDVITMASLVEREARTDVDKHMVAGILWNRIARGMPLQVDAVFGYIKGSDTYSPSLADLKIDSPYNTYLHAGLPPGPIDSPGLASINAVLHPTETKYLYYLTGKDGFMHYATTYAGHQANQRKYLN